MKKNFIMSIAALLIVSASVFATPNPADDFQYDLNRGGTGVVIQKYLGSRRDVEIPAVIEGFPVVAIGNDAFNGASLSSVVIPDSVTAIGGQAFSEKSSLTKVTLPKNLITIGDKAFENCSALTTITIPAGVTSIGFGAFSGCVVLNNVTIPASVTSIGNGAFFACRKFTTVTIQKGTAIGARAFQNCTALTTVTLSEGVSVGELAFRDCSNLTTLNLPAGGVTFPLDAESWENSNNAFVGCPKLTLAIRGKLKALGYEGTF